MGPLLIFFVTVQTSKTETISIWERRMFAPQGCFPTNLEPFQDIPIPCATVPSQRGYFSSDLLYNATHSLLHFVFSKSGTWSWLEAVYFENSALSLNWLFISCSQFVVSFAYFKSRSERAWLSPSKKERKKAPVFRFPFFLVKSKLNTALFLPTYCKMHTWTWHSHKFFHYVW